MHNSFRTVVACSFRAFAFCHFCLGILGTGRENPTIEPPLPPLDLNKPPVPKPSSVDDLSKDKAPAHQKKKDEDLEIKKKV